MKVPGLPRDPKIDPKIEEIKRRGLRVARRAPGATKGGPRDPSDPKTIENWFPKGGDTNDFWKLLGVFFGYFSMP